MKKLLSILALALCFVACQNDGVENATNGDLVDVVLTVDAPELGVTRADGDTQNGKNSAFGAIDFLSDADWANYDLRYILEVYADTETGEGTPIYSERLVNCLDKYAPTTFSLRLVPNRTYKFVVFADFVAEGNAELTEPAEKLAITDLYYNTTDLRNITAITAQPTWGAMNEIRDAYFVTQNITISNLGHTESLTLTRPFAKLRVITTDLSYIAGYSAPGYVEVTYHDTDVIKSFNAVNGNLNTEKMTGDELTYGYNVSKAIPYNEGYDAFATNQTLFTDYLFAVAGQQTTVKFTMTVYESKGGREIHSHDFNTEIPIQRNHLTTIIGDLCTTQANITFDINDNFEDEFVWGWDDGHTNKIVIDTWGEGQLTEDDDYAFTLTAEGKEFTVTVNGEAVENGALKAGEYVLAEDAAEGNIYTFTVEGLWANATTRAMTDDVNVIGGKMVVEKNEAGYNIELNLVVEFAAEEFVRYSSYTYEGALSINKPALATPEVTATVVDNVVTLTWEAVEGAAEYRVTVNGTTTPKWNECTYTFTGNYGTAYTCSVVAVPTDSAKYSNSAAGIVTAETVAVTALATPVVEATVVDNKVTLTWNEVEGAAKYSVTVNGTTTPNIKKTSFEFTGKYETQYTFKVVAYPADEAKHTPSAAAEVTAKTVPVTAIAAPVVTAEVDVKTIKLTWPAVEGAEKYRVEVGGSTATIPATTYTFTGEYDKEYTFLVYAIPTDTAKHKTSAATEVTVKTDAIITLATPNVTATPSKNTIILSWTPVENAAYYTISGAIEKTVYGTEYTFEGEYDTAYTFNVVAVPENNVKYAASEAAVVEVETEAEPVDPYIYLKPNSNWTINNARFAVYTWNNSGNKWVNMTDIDDDGIYEVKKSDLNNDIIFCRMKPNSDNNWNNMWNQTADLTVPTNGNNLYTVANGTWDGSDNKNWSKKN